MQRMLIWFDDGFFVLFHGQIGFIARLILEAGMHRACLRKWSPISTLSLDGKNTSITRDDERANQDENINVPAMQSAYMGGKNNVFEQRMFIYFYAYCFLVDVFIQSDVEYPNTML